MLLDTLQGFVQELRFAGLPVSMTEDLDAMRAVELTDLRDREGLRTALAATLVKHDRHRAAFDTVFDVFFTFVGETDPLLMNEMDEEPVANRLGDEDGGEYTREELLERLLAALTSMNRDDLRELAARAVAQFAGMKMGPVAGGVYFLYRTLRQLDLEGMEMRLLMEASARGELEGLLGERLAAEEYAARIAELRKLIEAEIRRQLVADRGPEAMAKALRKPLPEDVDFMHASRDEIMALQRSIQPLARALAARLAQRRRRRHRGHLDFRRTVRASLPYGGVPAEPKFRNPHPSRPDLMILADVSGSVASFARFTLQFVYAIASQFNRVRSWVFVDGIDEVTDLFRDSDDAAEAVRQINTKANAVWVDGHSDYGHALRVFRDRHLSEITAKTSVIVLGDARNNYHPSEAWIGEELRSRANHVYWLNPEPVSYWDTGDSIMATYARFCDGVFECRNLRQLQRFVSIVAEQ